MAEEKEKKEEVKIEDLAEEQLKDKELEKVAGGDCGNTSCGQMANAGLRMPKTERY